MTPLKLIAGDTLVGLPRKPFERFTPDAADLDRELERLPKAGVKRLLILCPAFVTDCLETLEEIGMAGRDTFLNAGGETFERIPCLNDQPPYIDFLAGRVRRWLAPAQA